VFKNPNGGTASGLALFGGINGAVGAGTPQGDTWTWNGTTWSLLPTSSSPSARYDAAAERFALLVGGVGTLLLVLEGGRSPVTAALSLALLVAFVWWEYRVERRARPAVPLVPLRLLANPVVRLAVPVAFVVGSTTFGAVVYVSLHLQIVDGLDPVYAPGTGTPEVGGYTTFEAQQMVRSLRGLNLIGGDELRWVGVTDGHGDIILATRKGQAARFHEDEVRPMGRDTMGVTGIRLRAGDEVIGMEVVVPVQELLVVTEQGYGKRTPLAEFPVKHRATGGVIANSLNAETGDVAAIRIVGREDEEMMLITQEGTILRTEVSSVNRYRRASRGVTVMKPTDDDRIVSIAVFVDDRPVQEDDAEADSTEPPPAAG